MTNNHYYKDVSHLQSIDIYRICKLYDVTDPCIQHAIKKLLCSGIRNGGKDQKQDILEVIETLNRWLQMLEEDNNVHNTKQTEGRESEVREGLERSEQISRQCGGWRNPNIHAANIPSSWNNGSNQVSCRTRWC